MVASDPIPQLLPPIWVLKYDLNSFDIFCHSSNNVQYRFVFYKTEKMFCNLRLNNTETIWKGNLKYYIYDVFVCC